MKLFSFDAVQTEVTSVRLTIEAETEEEARQKIAENDVNFNDGVKHYDLIENSFDRVELTNVEDS